MTLPLSTCRATLRGLFDAAVCLSDPERGQASAPYWKNALRQHAWKLRVNGHWPVAVTFDAYPQIVTLVCPAVATDSTEINWQGAFASEIAQRAVAFLGGFDFGDTAPFTSFDSENMGMALGYLGASLSQGMMLKDRQSSRYAELQTTARIAAQNGLHLGLIVSAYYDNEPAYTVVVFDPDAELRFDYSLGALALDRAQAFCALLREAAQRAGTSAWVIDQRREDERRAAPLESVGLPVASDDDPLTLPDYLVNPSMISF